MLTLYVCNLRTISFIQNILIDMYCDKNARKRDVWLASVFVFIVKNVN